MKGRHPIGFIVKVASSRGQVFWLSPPQDGFQPILGSRDDAQLFGTRDEAHAAIGRMPVAFENAGFVFTIEWVDED